MVVVPTIWQRAVADLHFETADRCASVGQRIAPAASMIIGQPSPGFSLGGTRRARQGGIVTLAATLPPYGRVNLGDYALFLPCLMLTLVLALGVSVWGTRSAGWNRGFTFGLIFSVGLILSATLTPSRDALLYSIHGTGTCDLSVLTPPSFGELRAFSDTSLNVLLFVPLGIIVGLAVIPRPMAALLVGSLCLPVLIELVQLVVTPLGRACQSADVINNTTGLLFGYLPVALGRLAFRFARANP
jgi:glycopeptide antibiotics resistance protein